MRKCWPQTDTGEFVATVTKLTDGLEALTDLVGAERARWMAADAPGAIVEGAQLPPEPPVVKADEEALGVRPQLIFRFVVS